MRVGVAAGQRCPGQCGSSSGGTALDVPGSECSCQCLPSHPIFRDDLHVCVNDIHGEIFLTNGPAPVRTCGRI